MANTYTYMHIPYLSLSPTWCASSKNALLFVTGVDNRSHQTRVNGYQFVLAVARVASALFAPTPCASVTVCDHPTPCASVTVCDAIPCLKDRFTASLSPLYAFSDWSRSVHSRASSLG